MPLPSVTFPAPANEPIESLKLFSAKVAPLATLTALLALIAFAIPSCIIPADIVLAPE